MTRPIREPWNTASAMLFLVLAANWAIHLRNRWRRHLFLVACLPLLVVGGVGGTVYHAFRGHWAWLLMDWLPILLLTLAASVWTWRRALRRKWLVWIVVPPFIALPRVAFGLLPEEFRYAIINLSYASLVAMVLLPTLLLLWRTRGAHWAWPAAAILCFLLALAARAGDRWSARWLLMGSHWLWHVFGAAAAHCAIAYIYRTQRDGNGTATPTVIAGGPAQKA